jgi:predicted NAD/FAD-binding protein
LQVTGRPSWLTLRGGRYVVARLLIATRVHGLDVFIFYISSKVYVDTIIGSLPIKQLHLSTPVVSVSTSSSSSSSGEQSQGKIELKTATGEIQHFDHVILATHTDTSLSILESGASGVTEVEREILTSVGWNRNEVVLHCDTKVCRSFLLGLVIVRLVLLLDLLFFLLVADACESYGLELLELSFDIKNACG